MLYTSDCIIQTHKLFYLKGKCPTKKLFVAMLGNIRSSGLNLKQKI